MLYIYGFVLFSEFTCLLQIKVGCIVMCSKFNSRYVYTAVAFSSFSSVCIRGHVEYRNRSSLTRNTKPHTLGLVLVNVDLLKDLPVLIFSCANLIE